MRLKRIVTVVVWVGLASTAQAELKVASLFSDHVVLQQGVPLDVWGAGDVGKTVELSFSGQIVSAPVVEPGRWRIRLKPLAAHAQGEDLHLSDGQTQLVVHDVVVGEVWLAAGQSNMQMRVQEMTKKLPETLAMVKEADMPGIRFLRINEPVAGGRREDFHKPLAWKLCHPETVPSFSAVAWVFARRLHEDLDVPVGIIDVSWGGKPIEPFIPDEAFAGRPLLQQIKQLADQKQLNALAKLKGGVVIRNPEGYPGAIYDARMRPLEGCGLRGFIWYQAESNCGKGEDPRGYRHKMQVLVESWRQAWGNPALPVYFVQLPNYKADAGGWIRMREEQRRSLAIPHTGMAVTIDTGSDDVHPPNKIDVGERLARLALHRSYQKDLSDSGPLYQSHTVAGSVVTITFSHADSGLMVAQKIGLERPVDTKAKTVPYVELAGADGIWYPAKARIAGKKLSVSSKQVSLPQAVRYACLNKPEKDLLYNQAGLPASPFCSDLERLPWTEEVVHGTAVTSTSQSGSPGKSEVAEPLTKEERLAWFKEAKFGMFIHWGPYAQLAGEWKGQRLKTGQIAEWIMHTFKIPVKEYRQMASQFNPEKFNAEQWVSLAKHAGMKYLVITAKHHDGFAMYHSKVSPYNIVDHTDFKRDPIKELADECAKAGIKFCAYYSHREDWDHPYAYGNVWDYTTSQSNMDICDDPDKFRQYLDEKAKPQLREILTNYGPLGLIWFDRGMYTQQQGREFADFVHDLQPACLVNGRVGHYYKELLGDYQCLNDNGMPIGGIEEYWETPQTLNETWGYSRHDTTWKRPEEIIRRLVEIVSKGGNYLLNVGPTGEGVIPKASVNILRQVGHWVSQNGQSIYGTTASPFAETPWGGCTQKGNTLFLHVFNWPSDGKLVIRGLNSPIARAFALVNKTQSLEYETQDGTTVIALPSAPIDPTCSVIVLEIQGRPDVAAPVVAQLENGDIPLDYVKAITHGDTIKRFNRKGAFHISKWTGPQDRISWNIDVERTGSYDVEITYSAKEAWRGRPYSVTLGTQCVQASVQATGDWYDYKTMTIGAVDIREPGPHHVVVRPESQGNDYLMYFKGIRLIPR